MRRVLVIDINYEKLHSLEYVRPIENILKENNSNYEIKNYKEEIELNKYSHIIISGTSLKNFAYEKHLDKFGFIKTFNGKIFGICAGAQIISKVFGEKIIEKKEIGLIKINLNRDDKIIENLKFPLEIYGLHKKSFGSFENFNIILKGEIEELIKHKEKPIYACLFHAEVRNKELIKNFINL